MYTVSPRNSECYFLRMLLNAVSGPTNFNDLKFFEGTLCKTYRAACQKLLLVDQHLQQALQEVTETSTAARLRTIFAITPSYCEPKIPVDSGICFATTWQRTSFILHRLQQERNDHDMTLNDEIYNEVHCLIEQLINECGGSPLPVYGLPAPQRDARLRFEAHDYQNQVSYNIADEARQTQENQARFNEQQKTIIEKFVALVDGGNEGVMFVSAPGGTSKTSRLATILSKIRSREEIAIATVASGIAATLLAGGKTVHSMFKVPRNTARFDTLPTCNINRGTALARMLRDAKAIIIDEATVLHRTVLETLDRNLQDIRQSNLLVGGIPTLVSGDFRQILPVIHQRTRADIVHASVKSSPIWPNIQLQELQTNIRAQLTQAQEGDEFADSLLP